MFIKKAIKWVVIPTAVVGGAAFFVLDDPFSYLSTMARDAKASVRESVPINFELRRAKTLIKQIDPEILEARKDVARAEVDLAYLDDRIKNLEGAISKSERKMKKHREFLSGEAVVPVFHGRRSYGKTAVKSELARTFDTYRHQVELRKSKSAQRLRQKQILDAKRTRLIEMREQRNRLVDTVAQLEARKRQLDSLAASSRSTADFDTSSLSEAKQLLAGIQKRLDVSERMIREEIYLSTGSVDTETTAERDIIREMNEYFGDESGAESKASSLQKVGSSR